MSEKRDPFISEVAAMLGLTEDAARDTILRDLRIALFKSEIAKIRDALDSIRNALKLDPSADTSEILASIHVLKNTGAIKRNLEQLADVARWLGLDPLRFTGHEIKCSIDALKATNDRLQVQVAKQRDAVTRTELLQMDLVTLRDKLTAIAKELGISKDASEFAALRMQKVTMALGLPADADHENVLSRIKELVQEATSTAQLLASLKKERELILNALDLPVETPQGVDIMGRIKNLKLSCTESGPTARELEKIAKELGLSKEANVHVICAKIAFLHDAKNLADRYSGLVKYVARSLDVDENEHAIRNELSVLVADIVGGLDKFRITTSDGPLSFKVKVLNADHAKLQEWDRRAYESISSVTGDTSSHKPTILASLTSFAITASTWRDRYKKLLQGLNEDVGLVAPLEGNDHAKAEDEVRSQVRLLVHNHETLREIREVLSAIAPITPSTTAMAKWAVKNLNELTGIVNKVRSALNGAK